MENDKDRLGEKLKFDERANEDSYFAVKEHELIEGMKAEFQKAEAARREGRILSCPKCPRLEKQGVSGSNHGWVSYEEIWAVTSENGRRLFEELTSVPTRENSVKFIATYAGFEGESQLLMDLYKKAVDRDEHPEDRAVRIHPTLPIYENQRGKDFLLLGPRGTSTLANGGVLRLTEKEFAARNLCPSTSKSMGVQRVLFYFSGNL